MLAAGRTFQQPEKIVQLQFYNTATRKLERFAPLHEGEARLYTCGPTVYNFAHIGNFRAYIFEDLLRRVLKYAGYRVTQVMNLTEARVSQIHTKAMMRLRAHLRTQADLFAAA